MEIDIFLKEIANEIKNFNEEDISIEFLQNKIRNYSSLKSKLWSLQLFKKSENKIIPRPINIIKDYENIKVNKMNNKYIIRSKNSINSKLYTICFLINEDGINNTSKIITNYLNTTKIENYTEINPYNNSNYIIKINTKTEEDFLNILNFLNNNKNINNIKSLNQFYAKINNTSVLFEDDMSYENVLAFVLCNYLIDLKEKNALYKASKETLSNYILNLINNIYSNRNTALMIAKSETINTISENRTGIKLYNFVKISYLIYLSITSTINKEDYIKYIKLITNNTLEKNSINSLDTILNYNIEETLNNFIEHEERKSSISGYAEEILAYYYYENNHYCITDENNYNKTFKKYIPIHTLKKLFKDKASIKTNSETIEGNPYTYVLYYKMNIFIEECQNYIIDHNIDEFIFTLECSLLGNFDLFEKEDTINRLKYLIKKDDIKIIIYEYMNIESIIITKNIKQDLETFANCLYNKKELKHKTP